jgi:hypothetical protein
MISNFFKNLNSFILPEEEHPRYYTNFYNYSNISNLEDVVIYEQPRRNSPIKKSRSDPNLRINFIEIKNPNTQVSKETEWDIL